MRLKFALISIVICLFVTSCSDGDPAPETPPETPETPEVETPLPPPAPNEPANPETPRDTTVSLLRFSPETAQIGETIKLYGKNFGTNTANLKIAFDTAQATIVSLNDSIAEVKVPESIPQAVVKIQLVKGDDKKESATDFTLLPPTLTAVYPMVGSPGSGVKCYGKGMPKSPEFLKIMFGDRELTTWENEYFTVPSDITENGRYAVKFIVAGLTVEAPEPYDLYAPVIESVSTTAITQNTMVTITGKNLIDDLTGEVVGVRIQAAAPTGNWWPVYNAVIVSASPDNVTFKIPQMSNGKYSFRINIRMKISLIAVDLKEEFTYTE